MNYEAFEIYNQSPRPLIPQSAYKPIVRCPSCQSVYLTDSKCEACGRSLLYHPIGDPFGAKSLYGMKERYYANFSLLVKYFPVFENQTDAQAKSYVRQLSKRFDDLLEAFGQTKTIASENRRFFYVETLELIDELLRYGTGPFILQQKIENSFLNMGPLLTQELLLYLSEAQKINKLDVPWQTKFMRHHVLGLRVEYILKVLLITTTVVAMAVSYYDLISSQVGK